MHFDHRCYLAFFREFPPKQTAFKRPPFGGASVSVVFWTWDGGLYLFCKARGRLLFHKTAPWDFQTVHKSPRGSQLALYLWKKWTNQSADGSVPSPLNLRLFSCHFMVLDHQHKVEKSERLTYSTRRRYRVMQLWYLLTIIPNCFYLFLPSYLFVFFSPNASWILSEPHCALEKGR